MEVRYKDKIDNSNIPAHVAVIMDGNGRWAKQKKRNRLFGHQKGAKSLQRTIKACASLDIKYLTVYAFSTENWMRPNDEVDGLMSLLMKSIDSDLNEIHKNNIKIQVIGQIYRLPTKVQSKISNAIEHTKNNTKLTVIIALSYSGRWEIVNAAKKIAQDSVNKLVDIVDINEELFSKYLLAPEIPDPELLIRTSGEERISNFLLYQLAYSELYFTKTLWPDFDEEDFYKAIVDYQNRERRFGMTNEQILKQKNNE